jgi:16S rRNA (guanine527-N7)-methyltransferase
VPSPSRLRLSEADRRELSDGAAALGVALDALAVSKLTAFADLLSLWSDRVNLIACSSAHELVERHLLDALAVESLLPESGTMVDLGSGAGFPGVPLAAVSEIRRTILVEPRRRRASFLREVRRSLPLTNAEILELRAEMPGEGYRRCADVVVVRAVWSRPEDLSVAGKWLRQGGRLFWMRGSDPQTLPSIGGFTWERRASYRIGSGPTRAVEVLRAES